MPKTINTIFFSILLSLSFLTPTFTPPWNSFSMEFMATLFATYFIATEIFLEKKFGTNDCLNHLLFAIFICTLTIFFSNSSSIENNALFFSYTCTGFLVFFCASNIKDKENLKITIATILLGTSLASSIIQIYQYIYADDISSIWISSYPSIHGRPYGNFNQPNNAGTFNLIGLLSLIFLTDKLKISKKIYFSSIPLLIISIGITLAASKTTFLSILIILFFSILLKYKNAIATLTLALLISLCINQSDWFTSRDYISHGITTLRYELWRDIIAAIKNSPALGFGANGTIRAFFEIADSSPTKWDAAISNSHNILLEILVWFGLIPGTVICICLIAFLGIFIFKNKNDFFCFLSIPIAIHSLAEFPYIYANFLFLQMLTMGVCMNNNKKSIKTIYAKILFLLTTTIFIFVFIDYTDIKEKYTDLRFYENRFNSSKKPIPLNSYLLDKTSNQYNFFLKEEIANFEIDFLENLTRYSPTKKNFYLILSYHARQKNTEDFNYWKRKAIAIVPEKENEWFKKYAIE